MQATMNGSVDSHKGVIIDIKWWLAKQAYNASDAKITIQQQQEHLYICARRLVMA